MNPVRVLLVEDGTGDTLATRQAITQCPIPIELTATRSGEEALLRLVHPNTKPDLVILDWNIPRISENVLLQRYQSQDTPVVVFSSICDEDDIKRAIALGAQEFIKKPTDSQKLTEAVCGIIQKWATPGNV